MILKNYIIDNEWFQLGIFGIFGILIEGNSKASFEAK
jgi:hypothetical protein